MFKLIRMKKRGDKLPAEFRQEWLEKNREVRKTANKVIASVVADGKPLGDEPMYDGVAALYFPTEREARAADEKNLGKDAISVVAEEKVLFERTGATLKPLGQFKVILASVRKKELSPAQFKDASLKGYAKAESKALMDSGIQRIVANFSMPEKDQANPAFDVMLELYFPGTDEVKAAFASPVIGMLRKDEETLVQLDAAEIRIVAEEYVL
jgi:hypothetical protein